VASWIKGGEVGQPKFDPVTKEIIATHRNTSDVTQQKLNIRRQKNDASTAYHNDLQALVDAKQHQRIQERETEKQDSIKVSSHCPVLSVSFTTRLQFIPNNFQLLIQLLLEMQGILHLSFTQNFECWTVFL